MTLNLNIPAVDTAASIEGKYFHFLNGMECRIARYGNPRHSKATRDLLKRHEGKPDAEDLVDEVAAIMADTLLLDWKGLTNGDPDNPEAIPYSRETAIQLLSAPEYVHFQSWVERTSKEMANFYSEEKSDTVKT